jgi:hypothetical protein
MTEITAEQTQEILGMELGPNDSGASTVRGYLVALLRELWREGEGFSGKRPFGNSSWEYDLYPPLIKAGLIRGKLDEDGYIEDVDDKRGDELIAAAIASLDVPPAASRDALEALAAKWETEAIELAQQAKLHKGVAAAELLAAAIAWRQAARSLLAAIGAKP